VRAQIGKKLVRRSIKTDVRAKAIVFAKDFYNELGGHISVAWLPPARRNETSRGSRMSLKEPPYGPGRVKSAEQILLGPFVPPAT
jgi:hypothetical protein